MWFTPSSVVHYRLKGAIAAEDIRLFAWRWNMRSIRKGYLYFEQKWNLDISERGQFRYFLLHYNDQLGLLPRLFPSTTALRLENGLARLLGTVVKPLNGLLRDRVGQGSTALAPDGAPDGTLTVTLSAPGGRTVTALRLDSNAPGTLRAAPGSGPWPSRPHWTARSPTPPAPWP